MRPGKWWGGLLASILLLTGCAPQTTEPAPEALAPAVPMGRYVEMEITPPGMAKADMSSSVNLRAGTDGTVDYFVRQSDAPDADDRIVHYRSSDGGATWTEQDLSWIDKVWQACGMEPRGDWLAVMDMADDESFFCAVYDGENNRLFRVAAGGETLTELTPEEWKDSGQWGVEMLRVTPGGGLGVWMMGLRDTAVLYDASGGKLAEIELAPIEQVAFDSDTIFHGRDALVMTGARTEKLILPHGGDNIAMDTGADGTLFIASHSGIDRLGKGAGVFETILPSSLYSFSSPNSGIEMLRAGADEDTLFLALRQDISSRLFRYTYDPDVPTKPGTQLNVFSVEDSITMRNAMLAFQREHPNAAVRYQVGLSADSPLEKDEVTASLENEMSLGKGPDVLLLDGLDWRMYAQKGWLAPLEKMPDGVFANLAGVGMDADTRYAVPTRFLLGLQITIDGSEPFLQTASGPESLDYLLSLVDEGHAVDLTGRSGFFSPRGMAAVNAAGEQQELAKAFIAAMLSQETQGLQDSIGFPVLRDTFAQMLEQDFEDRFQGKVEPLIRLCETAEEMVE